MNNLKLDIIIEKLDIIEERLDKLEKDIKILISSLHKESYI